MPMQKRPAVVRVRRRCIKRKTLRGCMCFAIVALLLLCLGCECLTALILSGAVLLAINFCINRFG